MQEAVKEIVDELKITGFPVSVALPRRWVTLSVSRYPALPPEELHAYLDLEARQLSGMENGQFYVSSQRLTSASGNRDSWIVAIVEKKKVQWLAIMTRLSQS